MQEPDDRTLLQEYVDRNSEAAFATLVARHVNKVYSVALRHTGNPHQADEITQAVFVILARKSHQLSKNVILSGWLYQTARLTSVTFLRSELRRARRERESFMQTLPSENEPGTWTQIAPLLDSAMADLSEKDRAALVLRFFDGKSFKEVGDALGAGEDAVKKRVGRAVEKLRGFLARRGVMVPLTLLTATLAAHSVQAAPVGLAKMAIVLATAKGATATGSTLTLIKGALKIMAWTKAKTAIAIGAGVLLAAGTTTVAVKEIQKHQTYPWQSPMVQMKTLAETPPQVKIVPSRFAQHRGLAIDRRDRMIGIGVSFATVVQVAYSNNWARSVLPADLSQRRFDFIANLSSDSRDALRSEVENEFHVKATRQTRETDVLLLKVARANASGLRSTAEHNGSDYNVGRIQFVGQPMSDLANYLEQYFERPVLDRTGLEGEFAFNLAWDERPDQRNPDGLKRVLLEQIGLELVPGREPVEMLVLAR